ncbi:DEAD-box ATP-dependent RNA helicase, partial [Trifolium medium]|nr:DEAD-box ATP-dependent RNA helicase [Trifolium medium]
MEISSMQKNLPRKKRRKLEAAREMLEDDEQDDKPR